MIHRLQHFWENLFNNEELGMRNEEFLTFLIPNCDEASN